MRTARIALATALLCGLVAAPATAGEPEDVVAEVNELRADHGLAPLAYSEPLSRSSERYAEWQMRSNWFGHLASIRAEGSWSTLGEAISIHQGHRPRVAATVSRWARSPGHAALMLSPSFKQAGAGLAQGRFRGGKSTIWVLQLGRR